MSSGQNLKNYEVYLQNSKLIEKKFITDYKLFLEKKGAPMRHTLTFLGVRKHRMHIVTPSPWPIYTAFSALVLVLGTVTWMHNYGGKLMFLGFLLVCSAVVFWFRDIIREGLYMGYHTKIVQKCLRFGFILFLASEVMFFFGFFWGLLHFSLVGSFWTGDVWPPQGIALYLLSEDVNSIYAEANYRNTIRAHTEWLDPETWNSGFMFNRIDWLITRNIEVFKDPSLAVGSFAEPLKLLAKHPELDSSRWFFSLSHHIYDDPANTKVWINLIHPGVLINPFKIPLLNTVILLTSGAFLTLAHSYLRVENFYAVLLNLGITVALGTLFFIIQLVEYCNAGFSMNDGIFGSIFYLVTGFHGLHVIIGTIFLVVCWFRTYLSHFTSNNHFAFEAAAWYWHFVDVVWILLYLLLYLWSAVRFYTEPTVELITYPPQINIEFSALYLPENFSFDARDLYNVTVSTEEKLTVKATTIGVVLEHFSPAFLNFDQEVAEHGAHLPEVGISPADVDNFYGRQVQLWIEGLTTLMRLEAASQLDTTNIFVCTAKELINIDHYEEQKENIFDKIERAITHNVMAAVYSAEKNQH